MQLSLCRPISLQFWPLCALLFTALHMQSVHPVLMWSVSEMYSMPGSCGYLSGRFSIGIWLHSRSSVAHVIHPQKAAAPHLLLFTCYQRQHQ